MEAEGPRDVHQPARRRHKGRQAGARHRGRLSPGAGRRDGKELWSRQIAKPSEGDFNSMPPLIHEDLALIGPAGAVSFRAYYNRMTTRDRRETNAASR